MAGLKQFKVGKTSWKKLDGILKEVEGAINERTPRSGLGTVVDRHKTGTMIHTSESASAGAEADGTVGGGAGTPIALYGARNGAPAIFHLLQSSDPTAAP